MTGDYSLSSRTELLADVVRKLLAEYPDMPRDQVVRCVQIAREAAKSADVNPNLAVIETQARNYLAKLHAIRTKAPLPPNPTVVELGTVEHRRRGRHRRDLNARSAIA
jgi:hypothetical protein